MIGQWFLIFVCLVGLCALGLVLSFVLRLGRRDEYRRRRLEVLEAALKRGDMDPEVRRQVVQVLKSEGSQGFRWRHAWFSLGWLGLFAGGGLALLGGGSHHVEVGLIIIVASLAVVTLPLAIGELEARRVPGGSE